ncbi:MAG: glycosyltransferase family 2 protein [Candidatus Omnitrophota bacterium]
MPLLSVIIPAYNEAGTIQKLLEKINGVNIDKEIIVIDNGSQDGTDKILRGIKYADLKVIHHVTNRGKGGAVLTGLSAASGEFVIIQDADLEYDPSDYPRLIDAIKNSNAGLVLGSRFYRGYRGLLLHRIGNKFITRLLNLLFKTKLNDYATCYKLASRATYRGLNLKGTGFNIEVEIICNCIKQGLAIAEVPVSYFPRTYRQGKKIRWLDGLWAIFYIFKYRFSS